MSNVSTPKIQTEEIVIPNSLQTFYDKKSGARTTSFPFTFPDGSPGINSVTKLCNHKPWIPSKDIKAVELHFNT